MTATPYNPDDPLFLESRSLDGDLSDQEREALERTLKASPELRAEALKLAAVDRLVRDWGKARPDLDWSSFTESVNACLLTEAESAAIARVDQLVARWAASTPDLDADAFTENVLRRLENKSSKSQSNRLRPVLRIGMPLAAAAVIVLAVMNDLWRPGATSSPESAVVVVNVGPSMLATARETNRPDRAVVSVSFSRERTMESKQEAGISFISISSAPVVRAAEEYHPL